MTEHHRPNLGDFTRQFMAGRQVVEVDVPGHADAWRWPYIVIRHGRYMIVLHAKGIGRGEENHLNIDAHAFVDGEAARTGVFGMELGRRLPGFAGAEIEGLSHNWPGACLVALLVGEQAPAPAASPRVLTAREVEALDRETLLEQYRLLGDAIVAGNNTRMFAALREVLAGNEEIREQVADEGDVLVAEVADRVVKVLFGTSEWDNGYFYDQGSATVYLDNGKKVSGVDFNDTAVETALTDLSADAGLGEHSQVMVDLHASVVEHQG